MPEGAELPAATTKRITAVLHVKVVALGLLHDKELPPNKAPNDDVPLVQFAYGIGSVSARSYTPANVLDKQTVRTAQRPKRTKRTAIIFPETTDVSAKMKGSLSFQFSSM